MIHFPAILRSLSAICLCAAVCSPLPAQSFLHRYRNPTAKPIYVAIRPLPQQKIVFGGAVLAGVPDQASVTVLDGQGTVLWSRLYGGQSGAAWGAVDFASLPDGNILTLFNTTTAQESYSHIARVSIQNGQILSAQRIGNPGRLTAYFHIEKISDGFILCGATSEGGPAPSAFNLMKLDVNGDILWQKAVSRPNFQGSLRDAAVDENGHIWAITTLLDAFNGTSGKGGLFHFDGNGELLEVYQYGASDPQRQMDINSVAWVPGKGPLLGGYYYESGPSAIQPLLIQCDTGGNLLWSNILTTPPSEYSTAYVFHLQSGGILAACSSGGVPNLGLLVKMDEQQGSVIWARDLSANDGVEALLAAALDENDQLFATGQVFAPLPALESKAFAFRTDEVVTDSLGCCTRPASAGTQAVAITRSILTFNAGPVSTPQDVTISQNNGNLQRQDVCGSAVLPELVWADTAVCPGQCVTLRLDPPGGTYQLTATGANPASATITDSLQLCFPEAGVYVLQISDGACARRSKNLEVQQRIPGPFGISDTLICPGACVTLTPPEGAAPLEWVFDGAVPDTFSGLQPPEICYSMAGIYPIRLTLKGCGERIQNLEVSALPFQIPNAFTPNADEINDVFRPLLECPDGAFLFEVYNRWGQKVYSTSKPDAGWDGTFEQEPAPMDVYVWKLEFGARNTSGQSERRSAAGHVTLIR